MLHLHLAIVPLLRCGCLPVLLGEIQHPTACIIGRGNEQQVVISPDGCGDIQLVPRLVDVLSQHFTRLGVHTNCQVLYKKDQLILPVDIDDRRRTVSSFEFTTRPGHLSGLHVEC